MSAATQEAIWLRLLLAELGHEQTGPTLVYNDNQGCIALSRNPVYHARTKHIGIKHHFVREKVADGTIDPVYLSTHDMTADVLTKSLGRVKHVRFGVRIGLVGLDTATSGSVASLASGVQRGHQ